MKTVVLLFEPRAPSLADVAKILTGRFAVDLQEGFAWNDQIALTDHSDLQSIAHAYLRPYTRAEMRREHYFHDWPAGTVPAESSGLSIDYHSVELVKTIVHLLAQTYRIWFDSGMGSIYSIEGFARQCRRDPARNWHEDRVVSRRIDPPSFASFGHLRRVLLRASDIGFLEEVLLEGESAEYISIRVDPEYDTVIVRDAAPPSDPASLLDVSDRLPWSKAIGGRHQWAWYLTNDNDYEDAFQIEFTFDDASRQPVLIQLLAIGSSLVVYELLPFDIAGMMWGGPASSRP